MRYYHRIVFVCVVVLVVFSGLVLGSCIVLFLVC